MIKESFLPISQPAPGGAQIVQSDDLWRAETQVSVHRQGSLVVRHRPPLLAQDAVDESEVVEQLAFQGAAVEIVQSLPGLLVKAQCLLPFAPLAMDIGQVVQHPGLVFPIAQGTPAIEGLLEVSLGLVEPVHPVIDAAEVGQDRRLLLCRAVLLKRR